MGLRLERFDPEYSPLIPDPMDSKFSYALELVNWIWDQSWPVVVDVPVLIPDLINLAQASN